MERGDISNDVAPKIFFVMEGLITTTPEEEARRVARMLRKSNWRGLADMHAFDGMMVAHLWDLLWRTPYSFSLVTITSGAEDWLNALEHRLDRFNVPYSGLVGFDSVDKFAQHIVFMPNILRIYHGHEDWRFKFGHLGEFVSDAATFQVR